jgi:hypothetical protein
LAAGRKPAGSVSWHARRRPHPRKILALTGMLSANALPDARWQSVQWQV